MKLMQVTNTYRERKQTECSISIKLLLLLLQYKENKKSLENVFFYIHALRKEKQLRLSSIFQTELQKLELLEKTISEGKIMLGKQDLIDTVIFSIKNSEKLLNV